MKKYIVLLGILLMFCSCRQESIPIYSYKTNLISFDNNDEKSISYSFISKPSNVQQDTVWFNVIYTGFTKDKPSYFEIEQIIPEKNKKTDKDASPSKESKYITAKPGVHFVDFNDAQYQKLLKFDAKKYITRLPIILLRDTSLKRVEAKLSFKLKSNKYFGLGYKEYQTHEVIISDKLVKPNLWIDFFFGTYGPVKHRFMIEHSHSNWDDEYLKHLGFLPGGTMDRKADQEYINNIVDKLRKDLVIENKKREEKGLGPLKEENGTFIKFSR